MAIRIYAADDDINIRGLMKTFLESEGYDITLFNNGDDLYKGYRESPCDLIVLDIMMPGTDGLTICKNIREISKVPIIMLTAKDTDIDYITGITMGSDDYLVKPFRPTMLVMRIKALLRRIAMEREDNNSGDEDYDICFGDIKYDSKSREINCSGKNIGLTITELNVMLYLLKRKQESVAKTKLLEEVWGYDAEIETRVTDETVRRIRKKLKNCDSSVLIRTVWGYGYKLDLMEEQL